MQNRDTKNKNKKNGAETLPHAASRMSNKRPRVPSAFVTQNDKKVMTARTPICLLGRVA